MALTPQPEFRDYIAERTHVTWTQAPDTWYYPFKPELSVEEEEESATPEGDGASPPVRVVFGSLALS